MGRKMTVLLLLAAAAGAQDLPLIRAGGTSLETFGIELRLDAVDHTTPEGLAKSFARFEEEQHGVRRRFAELVRDAHMDLLRTFYGKDLVDQQAKEYDAVEQRGYRAEVTNVTVTGDSATAQIKRTYIVAGREREGAGEIDLARDAKGWWVKAVRDRARDGQMVERPLGAPPPLKPVDVPAPGTPDLSSAKAAVLSLRDHALRFGALRDNAQLQFWEPFFDIVAAFNGEEAAKKARETRPQPSEAWPVTLDISDAAPRLADLMRVEVTVKEGRSAIGQEAFDLRADAATWKVVGEYNRPQPDAPFQAIQRDFGLFFIVRR